jgi:hypothetical protein
VHAPGQADLNLYAYVHGGVFRLIDELGLDVTLIVAAQKTSAPRSGDAHTAANQGISVKTLVARRVGDDKNFANRAEQLKKRLEKAGFQDVVAAKPETGWKLVDKMETASSIAPIKNLVIYSHATPQNIVMRENAGLFRGEAYKKSDVIDQGGEQQGIAYLDDIKKKMDAGQIRFSSDATIVLAGCNCGGGNLTSRAERRRPTPSRLQRHSPRRLARE